MVEVRVLSGEMYYTKAETGVPMSGKVQHSLWRENQAPSWNKFNKVTVALIIKTSQT